MEFITDWARQIAGYLIFGSVLSNLIRKQNYLKYVRLVMGIILIIILARPVLKLLRQEENYQFHLSRYLLTGEAKDSAFIDEISEKKEKLLFREVESAVKVRIEKIVAEYFLNVEDIELQFCMEEEGYGSLEAMILVLDSGSDSKTVYGMAPPDAIRIRDRLAEEFGTEKSNITITIY